MASTSSAPQQSHATPVVLSNSPLSRDLITHSRRSESTGMSRPVSPRDLPADSTSEMSNRRTDEETDEATLINPSVKKDKRRYNTIEQSHGTDGQGSSSSTQPKSPENPTQKPSDHEEAARQSSWYARLTDRYGSVTLENKGSVARDHLALERTFLAWLRTSLAFASIGVAITQLFRLNTSLAHRARSVEIPAPVLTSSLPFSPMIGHSIPSELATYLQSVATTPAPVPAAPVLGSTLLDQLLFLSPEGKAIVEARGPYGSQEIDHEIHAASNVRIRRLGKPLGATFIGISILILIVGFHRYFESQYWIIRGKFPASRGSVALVGLITAALIVTSLIVVVVVDPAAYERKKI